MKPIKLRFNDDSKDLVFSSIWPALVNEFKNKRTIANLEFRLEDYKEKIPLSITDTLLEAIGREQPHYIYITIDPLPGFNPEGMGISPFMVEG